MRNHLVTSKQPLLNIDGTLREPGWSKSLVQTYSRKDIKRGLPVLKNGIIILLYQIKIILLFALLFLTLDMLNLTV